MLGLTKGIVKLEAYNNLWPELYKSEEKILYSLISEYVKDIQHVGSTSVDGLDAKPIIDIAIAVKSFDSIGSIIEILKSNGYIFRGEVLPQSFLFVKEHEDNFRTHHLHVIRYDSDYWTDYILFRNYLRENKDVKNQYSILKHSLAVQYSNDRKAYTSSKEDFIQKVIRDAREQE